MRHVGRTLVLLGALAMAGTAFAAPQTAAAAKPAASAKKAAASHTIRGTVKSLDSSSLVLSRKKGGDMTFALDSATVKEGAPAVGAEVSVRYHSEGQTMMATAITAHPVKQVASARPAAGSKKK